MLVPAAVLAPVMVLAQLVGGAAGRVHLDGERFRALTAKPEEVSACWVQERVLALELQSDGVRVHGRWRVQSLGEAYLAVPVMPGQARVERATWNGKPAALTASEQGIVLLERVTGSGLLEMQAFLPGAGPGQRLELLGATTGSVDLRADGLLELRAADGTPVLRRDGKWITGSSGLVLEAPAERPRDVGPLALGHVALGLTVGDAAVSVQARAIWEVRSGSLARVALGANGVGDDLVLEGPNVARWSRAGDRIEIELKAPSSSSVALDLRWSTPISRDAESRFEVPRLSPEAVSRVESTLELGRSGDVDAIPRLEGYLLTAAQELPPYASGLITGTPTAAYRSLGTAPGAGRLDLVRFEPIPGPPVFVEVASVSVAASREGRSLVRARYEIVNERAPALDLELPAGARLVGAWLSGRETEVVRVGKRVRVALPRSLDAVSGLLSFPLVVAYLCEDEGWARRERRALPLPVVDAPINVERVTLHLPRFYANKLRPGDGPVVDRFTRGDQVAYGFDAEDDRVARADALFQDAVDAWQTNDFARTDRRLRELHALGAQSDNQRRLWSNLGLVLPAPSLELPLGGKPASGEGESAATPAPSSAKAGRGSVLAPKSAKARRIRAQLRARADEQRERQRTAKKQAQQLRSEGRYSEAQQQYQRSIDDARQLHQFDDDSQDYGYEASELEAEMKENQLEAETRERLESSSVKKLWAGLPATANTAARRPPPLMLPAQLIVPTSEATVLYQFVLLEAGARRSLPVRARQRRRKE